MTSIYTDFLLCQDCLSNVFLKTLISAIEKEKYEGIKGIFLRSIKIEHTAEGMIDAAFDLLL